MMAETRTSAPLLPLTGRTRAGLPVSRNFAPPADLSRYLARIFITLIDQPVGQTTSDFVLNETAFVRMLVRGSWEAELAPGEWRGFTGPLLFGPQSRRFNVRVTGPIGVLGFAVRPAGWSALFTSPASELTDRLVPLEHAWPGAASQFDPLASVFGDEAAVLDRIRQIVRSRLGPQPRPADRALEAFEHIARHDPTRPVAEIANELGLIPKTLQQRVTRSFGLSPKAVLRRSRFLALAATMRGVATPSDEELAALRYYDQSHLNREVRHFTGMTPAQFLRTPTPLLTTGIEARQLRKAEEEALLRPGEKAPWHA